MRRLFTYSLLLFTVLSFAQAKQTKDKDQINGNKDFNENKYADAEANYRISGSKSPTKSYSSYNLGNAIYRQKQNAEAAYAYSDALKNAATKQQKHMAYHNLGNVFMKEKEYQNAIDAYKHALRNNPADDQTRYNLALAKDMLKKNPPPKPPEDKKDKKDPEKDKKNQDPNKGGGKDDKKDKDDNKDSKDKGDKGDQKNEGDKGDKKEKEGDKGDPKEGDKEKAQPKPEAGPSPSKQRMENLLDAMNNEEKKIQDKVNGRKAKVRSNNNQQKDW